MYRVLVTPSQASSLPPFPLSRLPHPLPSGGHALLPVSVSLFACLSDPSPLSPSPSTRLPSDHRQSVLCIHKCFCCLFLLIRSHICDLKFNFQSLAVFGELGYNLPSRLTRLAHRTLSDPAFFCPQTAPTAPSARNARRPAPASWAYVTG